MYYGLIFPGDEQYKNNSRWINKNILLLEQTWQYRHENDMEY